MNPSMQCSVCGQWKRLHGIDENGHDVQRFYPCCEVDGEYPEHEKPVCTDCCPENCPNHINKKIMKTETIHIEPVDFKGTPGEFKTISEFTTGAHALITDQYNRGICECAFFLAQYETPQISPNEAEANAKLFAASKELLKAIYELKSDLFYQISSKHGPKKASEYPSIVQAEAAINKALGNSEAEND